MSQTLMNKTYKDVKYYYKLQKLQFVKKKPYRKKIILFFNKRKSFEEK